MSNLPEGIDLPAPALPGSEPSNTSNPDFSNSHFLKLDNSIKNLGEVSAPEGHDSGTPAPLPENFVVQKPAQTKVILEFLLKELDNAIQKVEDDLAFTKAIRDHIGQQVGKLY